MSWAAMARLLRLEMKMKTRSLALLLLLALISGAAFAHGDKKHVVGTVVKMGADSVTVKIADGSSVEVKLVAATVYVLRSGSVDKPAKLADLAVGDRVVIHATPKGETLEADEVKFSAPGATPATASKPKP
jgi:ABC-type Fe3+-hydroxamate transport system substrate-binding protein